ncbi:hypothetical protein [Candidatus Nitrotoga sp. M5]|uniref:hypothetical protein n=1 Tax=Candidatus Nitrotoga sp. M5 TaxID=2890409 RepID=UPI001EF5FDD5|nr:hypothetical protein [Candidatus Nitrotoga sp. M5]
MSVLSEKLECSKFLYPIETMHCMDIFGLHISKVSLSTFFRVSVLRWASDRRGPPCRSAYGDSHVGQGSLLEISRGWQLNNNAEEGMVMCFCRTVCTVIALSVMLLLLSPRAIASSEHLDISPSQPIAGQPVLAVLSGVSGSNCRFINPPVITRVGNQIDLTSTPFISTLGCLTVLSPYTETANLGLLPAGTYVVTWSGPFTPQTRTLIVTNPSPIPASSTVSLALAAAFILAIAMASLHAARGKQ